MDQSSGGNPNLEAILATLSQYSKVSEPKDIGALTEDGSTAAPRSRNHHDELPPSLPRPAIGNGPTAQEPIVNPITILDWSTALRHVMKSFAKNEALSHQIKKLIDSQHEHERQWWEGRLALIQKQKDRVDSRAKLDDVLRSVGAIAGSRSSEKNDPDSDIRELQNYDQKVLIASKEMSSAMSTKLQTFGIPFFGVPDRLLRNPEELPAARLKENVGDGEISKGDLRALQLKMLSLLEDLCG